MVGDTIDRLRARGVEAHYMLPVDLLRFAFKRIDIRNHRKVVIVDGRIGYTGSQNVIREDYGHKDLAWHDMMVRIEGPTVLHLQLVFMEDWAYETQEELESRDLLPDPRTPGDTALQVIPSGPRYALQLLENVIIEAINVADRQVIITSPYFVPDEPLLVALKLAALRGVRVDLIIPKRSDHPVVAAAGRAYYGELLDHGVHIHLFPDGLLHAKTMSVDDAFAMVGSANFDIRSFYLNYELNLLLFGSEVTGKLRFMQNHYLNRSEQLTYEQWDARPRHLQFLDEAAALLSPML
jgi:cardiolipin synthase